MEHLPRPARASASDGRTVAAQQPTTRLSYSLAQPVGGGAPRLSHSTVERPAEVSGGFLCDLVTLPSLTHPPACKEAPSQSRSTAGLLMAVCNVSPRRSVFRRNEAGTRTSGSPSNSARLLAMSALRPLHS